MSQFQPVFLRVFATARRMEKLETLRSDLVEPLYLEAIVVLRQM